MPKAELIELVAATFFRVYGIVYFTSASCSMIGQSFTFLSRPNGYSSLTYIIPTFLGSCVTAFFLFFLAVPLARFIRRGLAPALESNSKL